MPGPELPLPSGDKPLMLSPATWEKLVRRIHDLERRMRAGGAGSGGAADGGVVWVQNDGDPIELGQPVGLGDPQVVPDGSDDEAFVSMFLTQGVVFEREEMSAEVARFGVALEPIPTDAAGLVRLDGICLARVDVIDEFHTCALAWDDQAKLRSAPAGPAEIIWRQHDDGEQWCVVRLGSIRHELVWGVLQEDMLPATLVDIEELSLTGPTGRIFQVWSRALQPGTMLEQGTHILAGWHAREGRYTLIQAVPCPIPISEE